MRNLNNRLDRLEGVSSQQSVFIWRRDGESPEQAQARWLAENPDQQVSAERFRFIRRVFVGWEDTH